jgi:hypothetical protein
MVNIIREFLEYVKWKREQRQWKDARARRLYRKMARCEFYNQDGSEVKP